MNVPRAICFANVFLSLFFSHPTAHPVISESTVLIFTKFSGVVGVIEGFILGPDLTIWPSPPSFGTLAFLRDRNSVFSILNGNNDNNNDNDKWQ